MSSPATHPAPGVEADEARKYPLKVTPAGKALTNLDVNPKVFTFLFYIVFMLPKTSSDITGCAPSTGEVEAGRWGVPGYP